MIGIRRECLSVSARCVGKLLLIPVLFLATGSVTAQEAPATLAYCSDCSEWAFTHTAENAVPLEPDVYSVYVLDLFNGEVRYFDVHVSFVPGRGTFVPLGDDGEPDLDAIEHRGILNKAVPGPGDPEIVPAIEDGFRALQQLGERLVDAVPISAGDLGLDVGSAIELIGPDDSSASRKRGELQNAFSGWLGDQWRELSNRLDDAARLAAHEIVRANGLPPFRGDWTWFTFADGTRVNVVFGEVRVVGGFHVRLSPRLKTIQGPNLPAVPQNAGQFSDFRFEGSPVIASALSDLAERLGLGVGAPGGSSDCQKSCPRPDHCELACAQIRADPIIAQKIRRGAE